MSKKAVLLINLGTPEHCDSASVRRYLHEFLNDPRVIDLPAILRWPLINLMVIPFRYKKVTKEYQNIWNNKGSPLLDYSRQMQDLLSRKLGAQYIVELGMRYGNPGIDEAFEKIKDSDSIVVVPLYPQYSSAATGSAIEKFLLLAAKQWNMPGMRIIKDFYNHPGFITAFTESIRKTLGDKTDKFILFSYHGLPERHITKSACRAQCDKYNACPVMNDDNQFCYRAQCYQTTHLIAKKLGLAESQYMVAFQSRIGRTPWIKPYTDLVLPELIQKGIHDIAVVSPSFVSDCLETLEEIDIRAREQWRLLGGVGFTFIPCLNASETWISALADMVKANSGDLIVS